MNRDEIAAKWNAIVDDLGLVGAALGLTGGQVVQAGPDPHEGREPTFRDRDIMVTRLDDGSGNIVLAQPAPGDPTQLAMVVYAPGPDGPTLLGGAYMPRVGSFFDDAPPSSTNN